jgi:hypothetical protein
MKKDKRRALRVALNVPTVVEPISQPAVELHENLARVYERVAPAGESIGQKFPGVVRDLSTNGAFIAGEALPLLSRVSFKFMLTGYGQVEVIGWTLWRRSEDCELPRADGSSALLPHGFGVLFEAIGLDARLAIHKLVTETEK